MRFSILSITLLFTTMASCCPNVDAQRKNSTYPIAPGANLNGTSSNATHSNGNGNGNGNGAEITPATSGASLAMEKNLLGMITTTTGAMGMVVWAVL